MSDKFDKAAQVWRPELIALLTELQTEIGDDYRATDDPADEEPAMSITIATDDDCTDWQFQTGDNSYTGGCYSYPYWGVGSIARVDSAEQIANAADALLDELGENWYSGQN